MSVIYGQAGYVEAGGAEAVVGFIGRVVGVPVAAPAQGRAAVEDAGAQSASGRGEQGFHVEVLLGAYGLVVR
ncbi:hypothetical protein [Streptomyces sp. NPDC002104]